MNSIEHPGAGTALFARSRRFGLYLLLSLVLFSSATAAYLWPLPYGDDLSSIYGNWRSRRYHLGVDIRTGGKEGRPVVAPKSGYIYRVYTSYRGYGRALYLKMDDGNIAVFGHLSRFRPEIEEYLQENQLAKESYALDLYPLKEQFACSRGDTIAWSGSSGVGAPHLHFEVRTPDNVPVNPLRLPGLGVPDKRSPQFAGLLLVSSLDDELAEALGYPVSYDLTRDKIGGRYRTATPVKCPPYPFWLAVSAYDRVSGSNWQMAVYSIELKQGERTLYRQVHDSTSFADNYLIDLHRNFRMAVQNHKFYENLVDRPTLSRAHGILNLIGDRSEPLGVVATDAAGNSAEATIDFAMRDSSEGFTANREKLRELIARNGSHIGDLSVAFRPAGDSLLILFEDHADSMAAFDVIGLQNQMSRAKPLGGGFYLAVVHRVSDDSLSTNPARSVQIRRLTRAGDGEFVEVKPDYMPPRLLASDRAAWSSDDGRLEMVMKKPEDAFLPLYRNSYFRIATEENGNDVNYSVSPDNLALRTEATYRFHLDADEPFPGGTGLYSVDDDGEAYFLGAAIDSVNSVVQANYIRLSTITMRIDTIAPSIRHVLPADGSKVYAPRPEISATLADSLSGIENEIEVRVDGVWLIPNYDFESGQVTASPHFNLKPGRHRLDIIVADRIGNRRHYTGGFTFIQ